MINGHSLNGHTNGIHHALEGEAIVVPAEGSELAYAECVDCSKPGPDLPAGRRWLCSSCAQLRVEAAVVKPRMCCQRIPGGGWCTLPDGHPKDRQHEGITGDPVASNDYGPRGKR